jgi:hypothetical protein
VKEPKSGPAEERCVSGLMKFMDSLSESPRVETMCGAAKTLKGLRFKRDLAARDGDMATALKCSIEIDKLRGRYGKAMAKGRQA